MRRVAEAADVFVSAEREYVGSEAPPFYDPFVEELGVCGFSARLVWESWP